MSVKILCICQLSVKVIPQKKRFRTIFLNVPYMFLTNVFLENTIKKIGLHVCLKDMVGQTYSIYACLLTLITCVILSVHSTFRCSWKQRLDEKKT